MNTEKTLYDIIIEIPHKQYEKICFHSSFASCVVKNMKISEVETDSTSGIVQFDKCILNRASGKTVNGRIKMILCSASNVKMSAVNGVLWMDDSEVTDLNLDVINGDIMLNQKLA